MEIVECWLNLKQSFSLPNQKSNIIIIKGIFISARVHPG